MKADFLPNMMAECHPISIPYVMIVESDPELAHTLQNTLKYEMKTGTIFAGTMDDALNITRALRPILFLINSHLLGGDGLTLVDQFHQNSILASVPMLLLTTDIHSYQEQAEKRKVSCLPIPIELDCLLAAIRDHLPANALEEEPNQNKEG